jgi:1-deoxy-D-xylulose-5-phosphate reductoisomerase
MKVPIQYALSYPKRMPLQTEPLDLTKCAALHFAPMDFRRYPLLKLAYDCGKSGGSAPAVLNAANEIAVARFLRGEITFLAIERIVEQVCSLHKSIANPSLEEIMEADQWARKQASQL